VAVILFMGVALGILWGIVSLSLWTFNERVFPVLIAPLWITAAIGAHLPVSPLVLGTLVSAALGLVPAVALLALARARSW
jgi:hypothetical protein